MNLPRLVEGLLEEHGELDPRVLMAKRMDDDSIEALFTTGTAGPKRQAKTAVIRDGQDPKITDGFQADTA